MRAMGGNSAPAIDMAGRVRYYVCAPRESPDGAPHIVGRVRGGRRNQEEPATWTHALALPHAWKSLAGTHTLPLLPLPLRGPKRPHWLYLMQSHLPAGQVLT